MSEPGSGRHLSDASPHLARILARGGVFVTPRKFDVADIRCETVMVPMRDGIRLATDIYLPPQLPAPTVAMRTPYDKGDDLNASLFLAFARRGYACVAQDCRGTGESEPDRWDHYVNEPEDGFDFVDWVSRQDWFDGFLGSCGASYIGQTQWQMAMHPRMSTIVPGVSGLGVAVNTVHLHMFVNALARSLGKSAETDIPFEELEGQILAETLSTGYYNEPPQVPLSDELLKRFPHVQVLPDADAKRWLWEHYCSLTTSGRAELIKLATGVENITMVEVESLPAVFGHQISHDRHTLPHPNLEELAGALHAPVLFRTGWYDWGVNDALATWELLMQSAPKAMRDRCRLFLAPSAHNMPGYHEGMAEHPELQHNYGSTFELLLHWYEAVRTDTVDSWPTVIYYLLGANEWRVADAWPPPDAQEVRLYLGAGATLTTEPPSQAEDPDRYTYDPEDPTPTVGGSIVSYVYPPGSVDVSEVQARPDVLTFTTGPLEADLDVAGPLRLILYAASSALDTDFAARLTDVFPDGRAIQLQNGVLRARYRELDGPPELLEPGRIYRFEIDMWATANRFKAGHRLRVDISSADFPRFDRNTNRGGEPGPPIRAEQTLYHDPEHLSHLLLAVTQGAFPAARG